MAHLSLKHNIIKIFATTNHSSTKNPPNGGFYKIKDNNLDTSSAGNVVYITLHELPAPLVDKLLDLIYFYS